ncbi:hypothetical protein M5D96_006218 [Drosophila gunungcola]|uniref:Uncharacterized protein n=1 Tax=Drosophila gunungcola TaxID=103775 RepID=A0A9P9YNJ7_9MUSC|nr:hypothetical protein M5D96_006218 [Drosophila gunungcola]
MRQQLDCVRTRKHVKCSRIMLQNVTFNWATLKHQCEKRAKEQLTAIVTTPTAIAEQQQPASPTPTRPNTSGPTTMTKRLTIGAGIKRPGHECLNTEYRTAGVKRIMVSL